MKMRWLFAVVACILVGLVQILVCVSLLGWLAAMASAYRFWGLPVAVVMQVESLLAWVPVSLLVGFLVGRYAKSHAWVFSFFTATCALAWLCMGWPDLWSLHSSAAEALQAFVYLFRTAGVYLLLATLCGTYLAVRGKRVARADQ